MTGPAATAADDGNLAAFVASDLAGPVTGTVSMTAGALPDRAGPSPRLEELDQVAGGVGDQHLTPAGAFDHVAAHRQPGAA
jgi:hypothetical protein